VDKWLFENGERLGIISLLLGGFGVFVSAWLKEWIILGATHRRMLADKDVEIERIRADVDVARDRAERLLSQLERTVQVAENVSSLAAVTSVRKADMPDRRK
jgi:hypothetical protein